MRSVADDGDVGKLFWWLGATSRSFARALRLCDSRRSARPYRAAAPMTGKLGNGTLAIQRLQLTMRRAPPEFSASWEEYQTTRQAGYARAMKRYGPHPHWFAQRHISQVRAMRRMLLKGCTPHYRKFGTRRTLAVWKEKRRKAIEARHRTYIRNLPYREQTRRIARLLRNLSVLR